MLVMVFSCEKKTENTLPDAVFTFNPHAAPINTIFIFDASRSSDTEDPQEELQVRWDFNNNGKWDTDWSTNKIAENTYISANKYVVVLEVKDTQNGTTSITDTVEVYNLPSGCEGITSVMYWGKIYHTVEIGMQCWFRENLNIGTMITSTEQSTNDTYIQKYCYNDDTNYCRNYGAYYQWDEAMCYSTAQGVQGICPDGWHIPTDQEWKLLEGNVDSQFIVNDPEWDKTAGRGFDAGKNLKSTHDWFNNGNGTDLYQFTALPAGYKVRDGGFYMFLEGAIIWTSTEASVEDKWARALRYNTDQIMRSPYSKISGRSVRCLRN